MLKTNEIQAILNGATGTEAYHRFSLFPEYPVITDGVLALAEAAECFWLLDIIGSYQGDKRLSRNFQVWELSVKPDRSGMVTEYNDTTPIIRQELEFTDFPLDKIRLFLINNIILLPTEY